MSTLIFWTLFLLGFFLIYGAGIGITYNLSRALNRANTDDAMNVAAACGWPVGLWIVLTAAVTRKPIKESLDHYSYGLTRDQHEADRRQREREEQAKVDLFEARQAAALAQLRQIEEYHTQQAIEGTRLDTSELMKDGRGYPITSKYYDPDA